MKIFKSPWFKVLLVLLFFTLVYMLLRLFHIDYSQITPEKVKEKILSFGIWAPVIYVIFYTLRPLILFPAGVLSMVGGLAFGPVWGLVYVVIGATISGVVEFFIARAFGRDAVAKFIKGKFVNLDQAIERHGFKTVLLIRLIPNVPYDIQNYSLGLTRIKFRDYFLATSLGIIPGSFAFVYLGSSLTNFRQFWKIIIAVLIFIGIYFLQKYLKKRHSYNYKIN